jgi:hypothetical protein
MLQTVKPTYLVASMDSLHVTKETVDMNSLANAKVLIVYWYATYGWKVPNSRLWPFSKCLEFQAPLPHYGVLKTKAKAQELVIRVFLSCFSVHMDRTTCLTLRPNDSILGKAKAGGREDWTSRTPLSGTFLTVFALPCQIRCRLSGIVTRMIWDEILGFGLLDGKLPGVPGPLPMIRRWR